MDPAALAGVAVAAIVRYLSRRAARTVDKAVDAQLEGIYAAVKRRVTGERRTGPALADVEADPEDPRRQGRLEYALERVLEDDPAFGEQMKGLLDGVSRTQTMGEVHIRDAGAVALQGDVNIRGQYASGRDLNIRSG